MKAWIEPLKGKYYGTEIGIQDDEGFTGSINIWTGLKISEPSEREMERIKENLNITEEDINNDILIDNGWGTKEKISSIIYGDILVDSHHETQFDYELAQKIVKAINNGNKN